MNALRTAQRVAGRAAVCAFVFAAACGGDRTEGGATAGAGTDTTAATAMPADTTPAPDTAAPAAPTSGQASADTAGASRPDTAATAAKPAPKPTAAATPKPRPTPAAAAPARDTSRAEPAAPSQDTSGAQAAAPSPDTPSTQAAAAPAQQDTGTQTANAPLRDPYHQAPRDTVSQEVYDGWKQYNLNCARCHGEDVLGSTIAPHLIMSLKPDGPINTKELFVQTVCAGRPERGMPAWCPLGMEMEKINSIYSYVHGRSEGKIGPGRPALRQGG